MLVGSALAVYDGVFRWGAFVAVMVAALAIQVGVNFANDLADARRGTDSADRIGPTRAVASGLLTPTQMRRGVVVAFGTAAIAGIYLITIAGWVIALIGVASVAAALTYTAGPWPYGYHGWGEASVFVFFGLVATVGTRYVYDRTLSVEALVAGVAIGFLASAILVANNVRDIDTDRPAGKRTLAVILGRQRARSLYVLLVVSSFAVIGAGAVGGLLPRGMLLALLAAPLAFPLVRTVRSATDGPSLIRVLKGTAALEFLVAVLLAAGTLIS